MREQYERLMAAIAILRTARTEVYTQSNLCPAWDMLLHAENKLMAQASEVLRTGE